MGICGKGAREGGKTEKRQQHKRTPATPDLFKAGVISLRALATTINPTLNTRSNKKYFNIILPPQLTNCTQHYSVYQFKVLTFYDVVYLLVGWDNFPPNNIKLTGWVFRKPKIRVFFKLCLQYEYRKVCTDSDNTKEDAELQTGVEMQSAMQREAT